MCSIRFPVVAGILLTGLACSEAADWPTFKADAQRSSVSADTVHLPLPLVWSYQPAEQPTPAWPEPGKELNRVDFDYAFQPVAADGVVYFGSSADGTVRALHLETGELLWRFCTGGPVRFAPTVARGKVYVASDDGWLYCLEARTGRLLWRFHAARDSDRLLGNGRLIARYPCRTDALVVDDVVYVTAGMWPTEGIFVYALNADTGKQLWCNDSSGSLYTDLPHALANGFSGVAPQGYLLATGDVLLVPTGRSVPAAFDRRTGRLLYYKPEKTHYHAAQYGGGYWCTAWGPFYFNPKNRFANPSQAHRGEADPCPQDGMIAYAFESGDQVFSLQAKYRVLAADGVLYTAGGGSVDALLIDTLARKRRPAPADYLWSTPHPPRVYCLAKAGTTLFTGERGGVTAFATKTGKRVWSRTLKGEQVRGLAVADGHLLVAVNTGRVLCFGPGGGSPRGIRESARRAPVPNEVGNQVQDILGRAGKAEGYALLVGRPATALAEELARRTRLHIVVALADAARVDVARRNLLEAGLLGARVEVCDQSEVRESHLPPYFADLIVVAGKTDTLTAGETYRSLRPGGGVLCFLGFTAREMAAFTRAAGAPPTELRADAGRLIRGKLPGAGEWRYPWADGGRSGVGAETRVRLPLHVLWFGGPGPGRLVDRHLMTSPPVSTNGRVFVEGENDVFAFDAYTGRELWNRHLPGAGRKYAQYYSSSLVADENSVYVVIGERCLQLDQTTGATRTIYTIPPQVRQEVPPPEAPHYVEVAWPAHWRVFGPFPKGKPPPSPETFRDVPREVTVAGRTVRGLDVTATNGMIDFTALFGGFGLHRLPPGARLPERPRRGTRFSFPDLGRLCYACARIHCPRAGKLLVGAGADWGMEWYLDGKLVFSALRNDSDARRHGFFSRRPCSVTDSLFDLDVTQGDHVVSVLVSAGSRGWALASASLAARARELMPVAAGENPNVPDLKDLTWGYLSVTKDLVLGSYNTPVTPGQPAEVHLLARSESKAVFALVKRTGAVRWVYRARPDCVVANIEIAWGGGRLFLVEGTSKATLVSERRRGRHPKAELTLVALNLTDGRELWRQDDVPVLRDRYALSRLQSNITHLFLDLPNWGHLVYARNTVLYGANAAYDADTGKPRWRRAGAPGKLPIVYGDEIITARNALSLATGKPRLTKDPLTGRPLPWQYVRAYGCGPTAGCRNVLFFRSGADGFCDMQAGGTTNFGGVRSGCSRTLLAANGLLIHPQGYSGCPCCYNFKTNLALVSAPATHDVWYVFPRLSTTGAIHTLRVNFGAPGDRKDPQGRVWLGFPRPMIRTACPAPVRLAMPDAARFYRRSAAASFHGTDTPWVYTSGVRGRGTLHLGLSLRPGPVLPVLNNAPRLDGNLNDPCWQQAAALSFQNTPFTLLGAAIDFRAFRTSDSYYFAYRRSLPAEERTEAVRRDGRAVDELDLFLMDPRKRFGIRFVIPRTGRAVARAGTIGVSRKVDPAWKGEWSCRVAGSGDEWRAEVAVPFTLFTNSGLVVSRLHLNAMSLNLTRAGTVGLFLTDPAYGVKFRCCSSFLPLVEPRSKPHPRRRFTVRLHFAETNPAVAEQRTFSVRLQGKTVLRDFNIFTAAEGLYRPVVEVFSGVQADDEIHLDLLPSPSLPPAAQPIVCGVEVVEESVAQPARKNPA